MTTDRFQPTRPLRGATCYGWEQAAGTIIISTHAPLAGRDVYDNFYQMIKKISTHAPLAGRDSAVIVPPPPPEGFQPTRPLRGATEAHSVRAPDARISTHAPLAGRDVGSFPLRPKRYISTHAPLAGRDIYGDKEGLDERNFNPRAPCGARPQRSHITKHT